MDKQLKTFKKYVRWEFKIAVHGYGRNIRQALIDASAELARVARESDEGTLLSIQNHELILIDENDTEDEI